MQKAKLSMVSILAGVLFSQITVMTGSILSAWFLHKGTVEFEKIGYLILGILFLTGITAGAVTLAKAKTNILITGCVICVTDFLILLSVGALFFEGPSSGVWQALLLMMGSTVATILVGTHRMEKVKTHRRRARTG